MEEKKKNYYELLGISYYASPEEIRRSAENALGRLDAATVAADDTSKAEIAAKKRAIIQAYAMLKDPVKRQQYNAAVTAKISSAARAATEAAENEAAARDAQSGLDGAASATSQNRSPESGLQQTKYEAVDLRESLRAKQSEEGPLNVQYGDAPLEEHAGVFTRFVAMLIDQTVVWLGMAAILWPLTFALQMSEGSALLTARFGGLAMLLGFVAYYVLGESGKYRATFGKWLMGLAVYRSDGETPIGWLRAAVRIPLRLVSSWLFFIGYLIAFITERKQTFHDLATDTVVFKREDASSSRWLYVIICIAVLTALSYVAKNIVMESLVENVRGLREEMNRDNRIDPNRISPTRQEVAIAYKAATDLQDALKSFYRKTNKWPTLAEREALVNRLAQTQVLRDHELHWIDDSAFSLSLGATKHGTARIVFLRPSANRDGEYGCFQINVATDAEVDDCESLTRRRK